MDINRKIAYAVLYAVEVKKQYSNIALNNYIRREKPDSPPFIRELVYGVLENKKLLDYVIAKLINGKIKNVRTPDLIILRMGVYQMVKMDSVPEYAAVNESVKLAKKYARGRERFINGVLRSYIREKMNVKLPNREENLVNYLSVKYSYEPWIINLWLENYDENFVESLLKAGNETPLTTIRANLLKTDVDKLKKELEKLKYEVLKSKFSKRALHVKGENLLETSLYKNGDFAVQDEASQIVVETLEASESDVVVDVCAAPGGKTLAIAEGMLNKGKVIAQDVYVRKVEKIGEEAKRMGISNIELNTWDGTRVNFNLIGKADKVLVDAPCSGLGVIRRKPEIKYKKKNDEILSLPTKQLMILEASSNYVKTGGSLLYSTCTINHYENERVVGDFIRKNPEFKIIKSTQLFPNTNNTDGFFICIMKKEA